MGGRVSCAPGSEERRHSIPYSFPSNNHDASISLFLVLSQINNNDVHNIGSLPSARTWHRICSFMSKYVC